MMVRWSCGTFGRASLSATWSHWRAEAAAAWSGASAPPIPNLFVRWAAVTAQRKPSSWCWTSTWTWSEGGELKGDLFGKWGGWGRATCSGSLRVRTDRSLPNMLQPTFLPILPRSTTAATVPFTFRREGWGQTLMQHSILGRKLTRRTWENRIVPFPNTQGDLAQRLVRSSLTEIHTHMYKHYFFDQNSQHCIHETLMHQHGVIK